MNGAAIVVGTPVAVTGGTVTLSASGDFTFAPNAGYAGTPSFTYAVADGHGGSAMATVTGTVWAPPAASNDSFTTAAGVPVVIHPLANDTDPNSFALTVTQVNGAAIAVGTPVAVTGGTVTLDASGDFTFAPNAGYAGTPSFTYAVADGHGGTAMATVTGTVWAPPAASNDSFTTVAGVPVVIHPLANDTDPNSFALTVTQVNGAAIVVGTPVAVMGGTVTLSASGDFTFAPNAGYAGTPSFTYAVADGHGGSAMATVTGTVWAPPAASNDSFTTAAGVPVVIHPLANDTDPNSFALTVTQVNGAAIAVGTPVAVTGGTVTLGASGDFTFAPNAGYAGTPSFTYAVADGHGGTAMATVTGTVWAPPAASNDSFTTVAGTPVVIHPLANDTDPNGFALTVTAVGGHAITAGGAAVAVDGGTVTLGADGALLFAPLPGYSGSPTFNYTVADGHGGVATASIAGRVSPGLDLTQHNAGTGPRPGAVQADEAHGQASVGDESFRLIDGADKEGAFSTGPGEHIRLVVEGAPHQIDAQYGAGAAGVPMRTTLGVGREAHSPASSVYEAIPDASFWHRVAGLDFSGLPGHGVMIGGVPQAHPSASLHAGAEPVHEAGAVPFSWRMAEIRGRFDRSGLRLSADLARVA